MRIGDTCGPYLIRSLLGEGAMGEVYLGLDTQLQRDVAIKVLRAEISSQPALVERFRNEATLLARLHHGNLCSVYAFFEHDGQHLMVLQYLNGQDLEALLRQGAQTRERALAYASDVLAGLAEAHALNIVHRDLKPANLMLMPSGKVVIMDFGIARVRESQRATRSGFMVGTIEYAPPEQIKGLEVDARSDLYALGIILYELLMGRLPFDAKSDYEWITAHTTQEIDLTELSAQHGQAVAQVVATATHKQPDQRFQTAADMQQALREAQASSSALTTHGAATTNGRGAVPVASRPTAQPTTQPNTAIGLQAARSASRWWTLARENPLLSASAGIFLVGIVFFALSLGSRPTSEARQMPATSLGGAAQTPATGGAASAAADPPTPTPTTGMADAASRAVAPAYASTPAPTPAPTSADNSWSQPVAPAARAAPPASRPAPRPEAGEAESETSDAPKPAKRYNFSIDSATQ